MISQKEGVRDIVLAYEGFSTPVLFSKKGLQYIHKKVEKISKSEEEELERNGIPESIIEHRKNITERIISMEWVGSNDDVEIITEEKTTAYHTYGMSPKKAYGYKKITYKNLYNGVDLVYSFLEKDKIGFKYSFILQPGADATLIKMKYGNDVKSILKNRLGNLIIKSDIDGIEECAPISFYKGTNNDKVPIKTLFNIEKNVVSFSFPEGYDSSKILVIDPFISFTNNLSGTNARKAKDIDYDYDGNIYITGGGDPATDHKLAKYNSSGVLLWTFNGDLTTQSWTFGQANGGWVVEKQTGKIYVGQGYSFLGFRIVRLDTDGLYDNYITNASVNFFENWKMFWNCNNGNPQIFVAGGGTTSYINFGIVSPPSQTLTALNITGITFGPAGQDIADLAIDPVTNDLYTLFSQQTSPGFLSNRLYKHNAPFSSASMVWNNSTGYTTLQELNNRPYLGFASMIGNDNSANMIALNATYLFYWDGKNLKAFSKATGLGVGVPIVTANSAKLQGGIVVDACNNVYVGDADGIIKVYNFNGTIFDDAPADIVIPNYLGKSVYDLIYDDSRNLLYACGNNFVASFDITPYCANNNTFFTLGVTTNCVTSSATASLTPSAPTGSTVTYTLYVGNTIIATNITGLFSGLLSLTNYKIIATINAACSGTQVNNTFTLPSPIITTTTNNEICGNNGGQIVGIGSGTTGPYTYSINGINFVTSGTFSGLAANVYNITVKDVNGCTNTTLVTMNNISTLVVTFTTSYTNTTCGNSTGTITASTNGGIAPYQYSINNGLTYQLSNVFSGLTAGQYQLKVKDFNGCISNTVLVDIAPSNGVAVSAIGTNATCGLANGSITAANVGGAPPFQYSINGGTTYQPSNIFSGLAPATYSIRIRDANTCTNNTSPIIITNIAGAIVIGVSTNSTCSNANGSIIATGVGGTTPLEYSIDGGTTYQTANFFNGLLAGVYTIRVKDANNCFNSSIPINVLNTAGATVSGISVNSTCGLANGKITAAGNGGTLPFLFSIDGGLSYQNSNVFNGLSAATYTITIKDANNCINSSTPITVVNTGGAIVSGISVNSTCGFANGTITSTGSGGTPPFQYSIDGGISYQTATVFNGLLAGSYTITIKDGNNCINNSPPILLQNIAGANVSGVSTNSICGFANGVLNAAPTGGITPYQYSIDGGSTYQAAGTFTGLAAAIYTITIKDGNNCINNSSPILLSNIPPPSVTAITNNSTCGLANGIITASANNGTTPYQFSIDNGINFQASNIFNGLLAGIYTVTIKDANGCLNNTTPISVFNTLGAVITATSSNATCEFFNGKIIVKGSGGATPYVFSIDGTTYQPSNNFTNLAPNIYTVFIKDANNCINSVQINVGNTPVPILSIFAGRDTTVSISEPLQLNAIDINNVDFSTYKWSPSFGLNNPNQKAPIAILDRDFSYEVLATTSDGCTAKDSINIKVSLLGEIYVPSAFTPNSDGKNDILRPKLIGIKELKYFSVYNRYGQLIFTTSVKNGGWNGMMQGREQNTGTFVWIAEAVDYSGKTLKRKGTTILIK